MTTTEQLADFNAFVASITQQEGNDISLDVIYDRWWQEQHRDEDLVAIQAAVDSYEAGERGRPADEFLAERRAARKKSHS